MVLRSLQKSFVFLQMNLMRWDYYSCHLPVEDSKVQKDRSIYQFLNLWYVLFKWVVLKFRAPQLINSNIDSLPCSILTYHITLFYFLYNTSLFNIPFYIFYFLFVYLFTFLFIIASQVENELHESRDKTFLFSPLPTWKVLAHGKPFLGKYYGLNNRLNKQFRDVGG